MENNNSRDYLDEHKEEEYDYEKMGQFMNYSQMPNNPMFNCPMYCPMLRNQPYGQMMPGYSRDEFEDFEDVEDFDEEDEYPDSFRQRRPRRRPFFFPRPRPFFFPRPRPHFRPRPFFFPYFIDDYDYDMYDEDEYY